MTETGDVDGALDRILAEGAARSTALGADHHGLWAALARATGGGKRFRPGLMVSTYGALDAGAAGDATGDAAGTDPVTSTAVARVGAALELLHTAFVVHDDVIDGDTVRRGSPNVSGTFAASARQRGTEPVASRHYGEAAGILAGDLALVSALRTVAASGAPAPVVADLFDLIEDTVHATAAGELADVRLGLDRTSAPGDAGGAVQEAVRVAELKTAVYSFQLPLQAGALLAGAPRRITEALEPIGRNLGIGFQLLDDLLGVFGLPARTGKSVLTDLREGKHTALVAHARTTAAWPALRPLVGDPHLTEHDAGRVRDLLEGCGARSATEELAQSHLDKALALASEQPVPPALAGVLTGLAGEIRRTTEASLAPNRHPAHQDPAPEPATSRRLPAGAGVAR